LQVRTLFRIRRKEIISSHYNSFLIHLYLGVKTQPSPPVISRQFSFGYEASASFVSSSLTSLAINPQVVHLDANRLFVVDFEDHAIISIVSDNMTAVKTFHYQISRQNSTNGMTPAVIGSEIDSSVIILYSDIASDSRLRALKVYKEGKQADLIIVSKKIFSPNYSANVVLPRLKILSFSLKLIKIKKIFRSPFISANTLVRECDV